MVRSLLIAHCRTGGIEATLKFGLMPSFSTIEIISIVAFVSDSRNAFKNSVASASVRVSKKAKFIVTPNGQYIGCHVVARSLEAPLLHLGKSASGHRGFARFL